LHLLLENASSGLFRFSLGWQEKQGVLMKSVVPVGKLEITTWQRLSVALPNTFVGFGFLRQWNLAHVEQKEDKCTHITH
jgi:hypothetical protein